MEASPLVDSSVVSYPGKPGVLRDLRSRCAEGEILGLVGQSGCGKSTLALAILACFISRMARPKDRFNSTAAT